MAMKRYSVFAIAREAMSYHMGWQRAWAAPQPRKKYDAVIVGAGGHGLATAYYLGKNFGLIHSFPTRRSSDDRKSVV